MPAIAEQSIVCPVCCCTSDGNHGNVVNQEHNHSKDRQAQPTVGNYLIDLIGCCQTALVLFPQAILDQLGDVLIPLIGNDALCIIIQLFFCGSDFFFNGIFVAAGQFQLFQYLFIPFKHLDGIPSLAFFRHIVQQFCFDVRNGVFYITAEAMLCNHRLSCLCNLYRKVCCFCNTGALQSGDLYDLTTQFFFELLNLNLVTCLLYDIHHIQCNDNRNTQFYQLRSQVQVPLQVGCIDDIQDCIGMFRQQVVSCNYFFQGVRRKGVNTRQVGDDDILMPLQLSFLLFYGNTRPVSNELIGTSQCIEQRCFSAVRIAGKGNFVFHT